MQKRICDICESPVERNAGDTVNLESQESVVCDKSAKIMARLSFGFVQHSAGFGGPPDLCDNCRIKLTQELLRRVMLIAEQPWAIEKGA